MLRIHFSAQDLLRVRVQAEPHVMWEILLSLHIAQVPQGARAFGAWRYAVKGDLPASTGMLLTLCRPRGYSPDFLTPSFEVASLEAGLDVVMSTPRARLRADMTELVEETPLPSWASGLADGDTTVLRHLHDALKGYHAKALQPYWAGIRNHVRLDRKKRMEAMIDHGLEHLLATLHPGVRWTAPVLEVPYPVNYDLHLDGRGLTLIPSVFCWPNPITLRVQDGAPILVYPVERSPAEAWAGGHAEQGPTHALTVLMGQTRAEVLWAIGSAPRLNTTDLARKLGISLAGASQHASILRGAGLVATARHKNSALHQITDHGAALLAHAETP
ncbi:hypothetical protein [Nonomuraea sp. NPDC050643]|uniref:ArsR/SmtB family transcription factor n=1 Tax=Nonomuraea sp. NPDC050643 TaxID=3155660 RepID=UPI00340B0C06